MTLRAVTRFHAGFGGGRRSRQRGLSLIEVAILLAVVGLILGASIVPWSSLWRDDAYREERKNIAIVQDAVLGYAASHKTVNSTVLVSLTATGGDRQFVLPAGRPYLPCPDVDGDGIEDREGFNTLGVANAPVVLTINTTQNDLLHNGNCATGRGSLPWKTLGVPSADHWGNRYTYQVDDIFSNALVGFDKNSVIDSFDIRLPVTVNAEGRFFYQRRVSTQVNEIVRRHPVSNRLVTLEYGNSRNPIIVCGGGVSAALCHRAALSSLFLEAGGVASPQLVSVGAPRRPYAAGDVTEGVPYVVVSHGSNGRGAVNDGSMRNNGNRRFGLICNAPVSGDNSTSAGAAAMAPEIQHEVVNFPQIGGIAPGGFRFCNTPVFLTPPAQSGSATMTLSISDGYFSSQPRAGNNGYDDIVVWTSKQELIKVLERNGEIPIANFPVLREY